MAPSQSNGTNGSGYAGNATNGDKTLWKAHHPEHALIRAHCDFAAYSALSSNVRKGAMVVPRAINTLYIPTAFPRHSGDQLRVFTEVTKHNRRGMTSDVVVVSGDDSVQDQSNALPINGFFCQSVPQGQVAGETTGERIMCFKTRWEPDMHDALNPPAIQESLKVQLNSQEINSEKKIARATYYMIADAVRELGDTDISTLNPDQARTLSWMKSVIS
ncbi:hypothetical protein GGS24DRAFT_506550 [Hypoxylon argillaceum]|nr:hypothetical protein GGS24DRAFT_506550 [Hypoxylon argillaceum]